MCFFFFKRKTAYEMRISDWSSDVCSSDLAAGKALLQADHLLAALAFNRHLGEHLGVDADGKGLCLEGPAKGADGAIAVDLAARLAADVVLEAEQVVLCLEAEQVIGRSEEHTSELQSLMRISYAVFCLKKKN